MIKFKEYFKPVQEQEELKEEVLEEAVYWHVRIPGISSPIFVEAPSKSGIKQDLRTQLKPEAWKDLSIDRITKPQIRKIYRDMAKDPDGPEETDEDLSTAEILKKKKIKISHPGYGTEEGVDEGIMDTAGFHNYPKRNKVGDEIEKIASKGGTDKFNLSKVASELQKGRIPHKFIKKLSPKGKKAVHDIMKDFGWKELPEEVEDEEYGGTEKRLRAKKKTDRMGIFHKKDKSSGYVEATVDELSKGLLQRASQSAKKKAGQQRAVSDRAASRVGDPNYPPGQNLKSKRANYQAAKKDYQAFKFGQAAKKKENKEKPVNESKGLQAQMALDDARIKYKMEAGKLYVDKKDVVKAEKALAKSFKTKPSALDGKKFPAVYYHGGMIGPVNKNRPITGMGR